MFLVAKVRNYNHRFRVDNASTGIVGAAVYITAIGAVIICINLLVKGLPIPDRLLVIGLPAILISPSVILVNRRVVYLFEDRLVKGMHLHSDYILFARMLYFNEIEGMSAFHDENPPKLLQPCSYHIRIWPLRRCFGFFLRNRKDAHAVEDFLLSRLPDSVIDPETIEAARRRRTRLDSCDRTHKGKDGQI